ncbi:unnamed protein product [Haemonchus placei]|uniref:Uncharacterized protein n=1 Tax=Haemonchus placei TaxID=6290 RepID=A0A0N4WIY6_HAEPC|nr:unnamed protein product [Haemonchus placei]
MFKTTLQRGSLTPLMSSIRGTAKGVKILNPSADLLPYKGEPVTNKPVKVALESGKSYSWCSCGLSKVQVALESGKSYSWCSCGLSKVQNMISYCSGCISCLESDIIRTAYNRDTAMVDAMGLMGIQDPF